MAVVCNNHLAVKRRPLKAAQHPQGLGYGSRALSERSERAATLLALSQTTTLVGRTSMQLAPQLAASHCKLCDNGRGNSVSDQVATNMGYDIFNDGSSRCCL